MRSITKSSKPSGPGRNEGTATKRAGGSRKNTGRPLVPIVGCSPEYSRTPKGRPKWCAYWQPPRYGLNDTRRFVQKPILPTRPGKRTLRNGLMCRWLEGSRESDGSATYGKSNTGYAQSANKRSPKSLAGTAITCYGDQKG